MLTRTLYVVFKEGSTVDTQTKNKMIERGGVGNDERCPFRFGKTYEVFDSSYDGGEYQFLLVSEAGDFTWIAAHWLKKAPDPIAEFNQIAAERLTVTSKPAKNGKSAKAEEPA